MDSLLMRFFLQGFIELISAILCRTFHSRTPITDEGAAVRHMLRLWISSPLGWCDPDSCHLSSPFRIPPVHPVCFLARTLCTCCLSS